MTRPRRETQEIDLFELRTKHEHRPALTSDVKPLITPQPVLRSCGPNFQYCERPEPGTFVAGAVNADAVMETITVPVSQLIVMGQRMFFGWDERRQLLHYDPDMPAHTARALWRVMVALDAGLVEPADMVKALEAAERVERMKLARERAAQEQAAKAADLREAVERGIARAIEDERRRILSEQEREWLGRG